MIPSVDPDFLQKLFHPKNGIFPFPDLINTWLTKREELRDVLVMNECTVKIYGSDRIETEEEILQDLLGAGS
ncbi:MAG: hypothetical protein ACFFD4_27810 [Candidatus Odinarchaeota archaeon]